jgi:hypothetical protein
MDSGHADALGSLAEQRGPSRVELEWAEEVGLAIVRQGDGEDVRVRVRERRL